MIVTAKLRLVLAAAALASAFAGGFAVASLIGDRALQSERRQHAELEAGRARALARQLDQLAEQRAGWEAHALAIGQELHRHALALATATKEKSDALRLHTAGRDCLSAAAVGVLNAGADPRVPALPPPAGGQPAAAADAARAATDTDVGLWIADARARYAACAQRLSSWIDSYLGWGED